MTTPAPAAGSPQARTPAYRFRLSAGTWHWQIRAKNDYGYTYADAEDWWAFSIPTPPAAFAKSAPANNSYTSLLDVTLSWGSTSTS